jgi:hypothetical protein
VEAFKRPLAAAVRSPCCEAGWRSNSRPPPGLRRFATPYVYMYNLVVLAVAVAFLPATPCSEDFQCRRGGADCSRRLILVYSYAPTQLGFAATLIVSALTAFRACCIATQSAPD